MKSYDINTYLKDIYSKYPESTKRPIIGITGNIEGNDVLIRNPYCQQVIKAGGAPVIIPPTEDPETIINILDSIDGIIFSGGSDFNPLWSGDEPSPHLGHINSKRDHFELLTSLLSRNRQMPTLGICRGMQCIAIASGGKVAQDIEESRKLAAKSLLSDGEVVRLIKHSQDADREEYTHSIDIDPNSILYSIYKTKKLFVISFHHQAGSSIGRKLKITAKASDGVIEALESTEFKPFLAVQWHPEWLGEDGVKLFEWLTTQAQEYAQAKALHNKIITLDSHCDTPMFFDKEEVDITKRCKEVLVDLHKMAESKQDVTTMVAYLPQTIGNENFKNKNTFGIDSPKKFEGRRSIMLAIENGLALERDIANVKHFAERGISYITLCHNGDNLICDSARGSKTHGGLSAYGKEVVAEMNKYGIMVDLSHAAESTFFDVLKTSKAPILCSLSNSKSLCDLPRNLTV